MAFELSIELNNQTVSGHSSSMRITDEFPTLSWDFDLSSRATIDEATGIIVSTDELSQYSYEIRISTSGINIGEDSFIGNRVQTGEVVSQSASWRYSGIVLVRGMAYYGQLRIVDGLDRQSEWGTFSFTYNSLPSISNIVLTPSIPSVTDDIQLAYDFDDDEDDNESGTKIRWFKNGVYQKQFDDIVLIQSNYLQIGDIWNADIYPSDSYEYGSRYTSSHVKVTTTAVVVSSLSILPKIPNPDDVLMVDYISSDEMEYSNVLIRWYINNSLASSFNDERYVKLPVSEDDEVRFEIKHVEAGIYESSSSVTIVSSDFIVGDIIVDGRTEPLDVSSISPLVQWKSYIPDSKEANYVSIKIGTFCEADNVYSSVVSYSRNSFVVPHNLLGRGKDYYISVALSDTQTFDNYTSSHFRIVGSDWEETVSNSTGWTLETLFFVPSTTTVNGEKVSQANNVSDYHVIRINDGDRFAEVRIYNGKIQLISGSQIEYEVATTITRVLTIAGNNNDIKVYLDREIIINGEGIFTQESDIQRIEIGAASVGEFEVDYKYFFYTTSGYFLPGVSSEYANLQFHTFMEFEGNEVVSLQGYVGGKYVFGLNPDNSNESSIIYAITPGSPQAGRTVSRTFAPINKIAKSPDGVMTAFAHARGATLMTGYLIDPFDNELVFVDENDNLDTTLPTGNGWELVRNTSFNAAYFDSDGFNINTLGTQ